ncbi:MAG: DUF294 nucleotidyltransferase-like domain-containing protein [Rhizobiaceae bacterium]
MKQSTGATPLFALEAVALDTETTGLDPQTALIVQLGTVQLGANALRDATAWEQIVDPGISIPEQSVRIHGITNAMAREAPKLKDVWKTFLSQIANRVIVGHSIGFDMAILEKEAKRRRLEFRKPRSICVRMLARIVAPQLADHSLDALASWLGVKTGQRHQALGDALVAGRIFLAMVPLLEERGIRTLAEAERAMLRLEPELERQANAGWAKPVSEPGADGKTGPFGRLDTYAYRHHLSEVMSSPVCVIAPSMALKEAMDTMIGRKISSVFVADPPQSGLDVARYAILTERDVMRHVSQHGAKSLKDPVSAIAVKPVQTIREGAFVYRAVGRLGRLGFRHLGVRNDSNRLVGIVSARDLLKLRTGPAIALDDSIEEAADGAALRVAWSGLPGVVSSLVGEEVDGWLICQIVSEEIRAMTRRASILAERAMADDGLGAPPCPYAVMVLGSGGRGESMLVPDQDNAIIFEQGEEDSSNDQWFAQLGERMAKLLDDAGIPFCQGGVMARNPQWRGSRETWHKRITEWVSHSRPQDILSVDIFFDQMPVHGDLSLAQDLFTFAYETGAGNIAFAKLLGEKLGALPNPFSFFGNLQGEGNLLDLKRHALFPVAALARALAIRHNIPVRSTRERIEGLIAREIGSESDFNHLLSAHALSTSLVMESQSRAIASGLKATNSIDLAQLSREQKHELKQALTSIRIIPDLVRDLMF